MKHFFLSIFMIVLFYTPESFAIQICETPSIPGEWDLADNATIDIPVNFDVGDVATSAYAANSVYVDITHTFAGDLGGRLISPDTTNIHLWQLGDGSVPPSTGASSCGGGGYDLLITDGAAQTLTNVTEGSFCVGANDDTETSGNSGGTGSPYAFSRSHPNDIAIQGTAQSIDSLSSFIGDSVAGAWNIRISDDYAQDVGTINEVCLDLGFAGMDLEFFVSSNPSCNDRQEFGSFAEGTTLYVCSNVVNKGTESFELQSGDYSNDYGADYSSLETSYTMRDTAGDTQSVVTSFTTGSGTSYPVGSYTLNASVTVTGTDTNFTSGDTLTSSQEVNFTILDTTAPSFSGVTLSSTNSNPDYATVGDNVNFNLQINPADTWAPGNNLTFNIGTGSNITTGSFTQSTSPILSRNRNYTVQSGDNGSVFIHSLNFYDQAGNAVIGFTGPYAPNPIIIDTLSPIISFTEDVTPGPVQSELIDVNIDDLYTNTGSVEYGFSSDALCDGSDSYGNSFVSGSGFVVNTETYNGQYICVKAEDQAGNTGYAISGNSLNIDVTAPLIPSVNYPSSSESINQSTPTLSGSGEVDALVSVMLDGYTYTGSVDAGGNWNIPITNTLTDGDYTADVSQTDAAGNISSTLQHDFNIDTIAPTLLEVTPVPSPGNDSTPSYIFSTSESGDISYGGSCSSSTSTGSLGDISLSFSSLGDATYSDCTIVMSDDAGNISNTLSVSSFIIDTTAPIISLNGSGSVSVELGSTYTDAGAVANDSREGDISNSLVITNPVNTNVLGSYTITYNVSDNAGNSASQVSRTVNVIDSTAPIFSINEDSDLGPIQSDVIEINVTDLDLNSGSLEYGYSPDAQCDGSDTYGNSFQSGTGFTITTEAHNGEYLCFTASDQTGNVSYQISGNPLNIDTTPPAHPTQIPVMQVGDDSGLSDIDNVTHVVNPSFSGTCSNGDIVNLYVSGSIDTSMLCSEGVFTIRLLSSLPEGTSAIYYDYIDTAGNISQISPSLEVNIDTSAPGNVVGERIIESDDSGNSQIDTITSNQTPTLSGSGEVDTLVSVVLDGYTYTGSVDAGGTWNIPITNTLTDGDYTADISQMDTAGNSSGVSSLNMTIDTINVTPTITLPIEGDNIINNEESENVEITGTAEPLSVLNIQIIDGSGSVIFTSTQADASGNWSLSGANTIDISSLVDGTVSLTASSLDIAGNNSNVSSVALVLDRYIPELIPNTLDIDVGDTFATIAWETTEASSSEIVYGLTTSTSQLTGEQDISPRLTSHSLTLNNLLTCTTYFYETISRDISGNILTDGIHSFKTSGCVGDANILLDTTSDIVSDTIGGEVELSQSGSNLVTIQIPRGYNTGHPTCASGAYFQLKKMDPVPVENSLGRPSTKFLTVDTYEFSAYCDPDTRVTSFDTAIEVEMTYTEGSVSRLKEDTLKIYRFHTGNNKWEELDNCSIDIDTNIITCETENFSTFGIFGEKKGSSGTSPNYDKCNGNDTSGSIYDGKCSSDEEENQNTVVVLEEISEETESSQESTNITEDKKIEETQTETGEVTLENNFDSCPRVKDIQNTSYDSPREGVFWDIDDSPHQNTIRKFAQIGIVDGFPDGRFGPEKEISRAEFLKVALISHCYEYGNEDTSQLEYQDVDRASWQARVITKAENLGMVNGDISQSGEKVFRPNDIISKVEAVKILMRISMIQASKTQDTAYRDITVDWHLKYVENGEALGLFTPEKDNFIFTPESGVQRQDMIDLIDRLVHMY